MEALGLCLFMVSAGLFGTLLEYPASPVHQAIVSPLARRALMGVAMGLTAIGLVYSPWGRRSGAHINPAVTLTFLRLGRIRAADAAAYIAAQFLGGWAGVELVAAFLGSSFLAPPVTGVATLPGPSGLAVALSAELSISFALVLLVLTLGGSQRWSGRVGFCVGAVLFVYITLEAPLSGMSMNPARTVASAIAAHAWTGAWIYFLAPVAGMLLASEVHLRLAGSRSRGCAKLAHGLPCIFCGAGPRPAVRRS
jgi:aquaporin Z